MVRTPGNALWFQPLSPLASAVAETPRWAVLSRLSGPSCEAVHTLPPRTLARLARGGPVLHGRIPLDPDFRSAPHPPPSLADRQFRAGERAYRRDAARPRPQQRRPRLRRADLAGRSRLCARPARGAAGA